MKTGSKIWDQPSFSTHFVIFFLQIKKCQDVIRWRALSRDEGRSRHTKKLLIFFRWEENKIKINLNFDAYEIEATAAATTQEF